MVIPSNPYCQLKHILWPVGGPLEQRRTSCAGTTMKLSELTWPYTQWQGWSVNDWKNQGMSLRILVAMICQYTLYFVAPAIPCFAY